MFGRCVNADDKHIHILKTIKVSGQSSSKEADPGLILSQTVVIT